MTPIVHGQPTIEFPAVAEILLLDANGQPAGSCSGTLVAPDLVLTAAHCLDARGYNVYFGTTRVAADPGFIFETNADRAIPHPQWDPSGEGFDIGLLHLAQRVPIAPLPIATAAPAQGTAVELVGWGVTAANTQDADVKRAVASTVISLDSLTLTIGDSAANTCYGDSGGPALAAGTIVGVTSFGDAQCSALGVDTRVDIYADFLAANGVVPIATHSAAPPHI